MNVLVYTQVIDRMDDVLSCPAVRLLGCGRGLSKHVEHRRGQQVLDGREIRVLDVEEKRDQQVVAVGTGDAEDGVGRREHC